MAYLPPNLVFSIVCILYPSSVFICVLCHEVLILSFFPPRIGLFVNVDWPAILCEMWKPHHWHRSVSWNLKFAKFLANCFRSNWSRAKFLQECSSETLQNKTFQNITFFLVVESYWYELLKVWPKCLINYMYKCEAWSCSVWRVGGNMIRKCNSGLTNLFETCHKM